MSLKDYKITDDAVQNVYVQSQPDILNGTTQENKAVFDAYPALIKDRFNAVMEILGGDSAASEILIQAIEGMTAGNVQQALSELKGLLDAYIAKIMSTAGAAEVGVSTISGMSVSNTQQALAELKRLIDNLVISALPPGSVTADMIADGAIVQLGALLAVAAAAAYDPEGSYAVGDYCTHGGKLHKCNTPIEDGEPWTAEHWTETTLAEEIKGKANAMSPQEHAIVPKNGATLIDGLKNVFSKDQFGDLELHVAMSFKSMPIKGTEIFSLPQSFTPVEDATAGAAVIATSSTCYPAFLVVYTNGAVVLQHNIADYSGQIDLFASMCFGTGGMK